MKATVLGAGMVGSIMATDLSTDPDFEVTIVDVREDALQRAKAHAQNMGVSLSTQQADLSDVDQLKSVIADSDIVLGALASKIGFQSLRAVIESGKNYADISFMPEDSWDLDQLAKEHGVTAVVDMGVAPGMSNLLSGYGASLLENCENIEIYVGGLPRVRSWPYEYKAGFSPADVLEEYTRPSRLVVNGEVVTREALSEPELIEFDDLGTLEVFNTDGLRSLAYTMDVPNMKEKTMRYPGHIELMRIFRETGLFSQDRIAVDGGSVRPLDVISKLMFPKWTYEPGEEDLTVMRIITDGTDSSGKKLRHQWDLLDYYNHGATSMSRTTAFPCAIMARLIAKGELSMPGVINGEQIGPNPGLADHMLSELAKRDVHYHYSSVEL
ncbi:MAG: saccharopine dehydrogenase NADP-binding domain-containing protein [Phycisphaerales bacterium]|nr:saccharopine dehydrogenase NADP-binding domain-containing protein [Phycisphaerales bacterium]